MSLSSLFVFCASVKLHYDTQFSRKNIGLKLKKKILILSLRSRSFIFVFVHRVCVFRLNILN